MLTFEEKQAIFHSFKLKEKKISNGRVSFVYPESQQRGQVLASQLHPSGNGYVVGKYMSNKTIERNGYIVDSRGWISVRDFSQDELKKVITEAMKSMSEGPIEARMSVEKKVTPEELGESVEKKAIPEEPVIAIEIPAKVNMGNEEMKLPETSSEAKKEPIHTVQHLNTSEHPTCSFLESWMGLTGSLMECGLLVWKNVLRNYSSIRSRS